MNLRRNVANFVSLNSNVIDSLDIQSVGVGLRVYTDVNSLTFSVDTLENKVLVNGDLTVTGDLIYNFITENKFESGLLSLGSTNVADTWDLGIYAKYVNGGTKYTGLIRDVSDSLQRWTFFKNITTLPLLTVDGITTAELDSVRMNFLYLNNGSAATPSLTFNSDTATGMYSIASNRMGFAAGGKKIIDIKFNSISDTELNIDSTTTVKLFKLNTINDVVSDAVTVSTGSISLNSLYNENAGGLGNDKWFNLYSSTNSVIPSYSGVVLSSPNSHYFMTNTGASVIISYTSDDLLSTVPPDYRSGTRSDILTWDNSVVRTHKPLLVEFGDASNPAIRFTNDADTGFYRSASNSLGITCGGTNVLDITASAVVFAQKITVIDGSALSPSIQFNSDPNTGFYRSNADEFAISTGGALTAKFSGGGAGTQQITVPIGGTATAPRYAFGAGNIGMYAPIDESASNQLAISLDSVETVRFRALTGVGSGSVEVLNSLMITPDGTAPVAVFYLDDTVIMNHLNANRATFQNYNIIDEKIIVLLNFTDPLFLGLDYSGNEHEATVVGVVSKTCEKDTVLTKRYVADFTGNLSGETYLSFTAELSAFENLSVATFSMWFKVNGALMTENGTLFNFYSVNGEISAKILNASDSLQVTIEGELDGGQTLQYRTNPLFVSVKDNKWHHVVIIMGDTSPHIYVDNTELTIGNGEAIYSLNGNNPGDAALSTDTIQDLSNITEFTIGATYDGTYTEKFIGYIKDIYITARRLTPDEINILSADIFIDTHTVDAAVLNVCDINLDSSLFLPDGTAANPSLAFQSAQDMGLYKFGGSIGLATAGTQRVSISDTTIRFTAGLTVDSVDNFVKINQGATANTLVFETSGGTVAHLIKSRHSNAVVANNYIDILLNDLTDINTFGAHNILRFGQSAAGPNNGLISVFGRILITDGSAASPTYSFLNETNSGIWRIGSGNLGIGIGGAVKLDISSVVRLGSSSGDAITKLYVPLGTQSAPSYSFIGDTDTGFYSSGANNIDVVAGNTLIVNISTNGQLNQEPIIIDKTATEALLVRKNNDPLGGDIFSVDTLNEMLKIGYTSLYISRYDLYDAVNTQRIKIGSSGTLSNILGLNIYNDNTTGLNTVISELSLGINGNNNNSGNVSFYYEGDGDVDNKLIMGIMGSINNLNIKADGSTNVVGTFTVSSTSTFSNQIYAHLGSVGAPSYSFIGDTNTGLYSPGANQMEFVTNGTSRITITDTYQQVHTPLRLPDGSETNPSLTFSSDISTGMYWISNDKFGLTNDGTDTMIFNKLGIPHEILNIVDFLPNGTNIRVKIEEKKLRASSNQTILNKAPVLYFKFKNDPNVDVNNQDYSISQSVITINGTVGHTVNVLNLVDSTGVGLIEYNAIDIAAAGNNGIQTTSDIKQLNIMDEFTIFIRFKLKANPLINSQLFIIGNSAGVGDYIQLYVNTLNKLGLKILQNSGTVIDSLGSTTLALDRWYSVLLTIDNNGNVIKINNANETLIYSTGNINTTLSISDFSAVDDLYASVGGSDIGIQQFPAPAMYVAEFYVSPITTTEIPTALYPLQVHEVYTNSLQMINLETGLVDEGYIIRSDKGNNLLWDNSLIIRPFFVELTNSKSFRAPNGTVGFPAYSFTLSPSTGIYSPNTNVFGISTNGVARMDISTIENLYVPLRISHQADGTQLQLSKSSGVADSGFSAKIQNLTAIPEFINSSANDSVLTSDTAGSSMHLVSGSGLALRSINSTSQTMINIYGSDGAAYNEALRIFTTDNGANSAGYIRIRSNQDPATPTYAFLNNTTSGLYSIGSNNIGLSTDGIKRVDISNTNTQIENNLKLNSGICKNFDVDATTTINLDETYCILEVSNIGTVTINLPDINSTHRGREYNIIKTGSNGTITIQTFDNNDHIDNDITTSIQLTTQYDRVILICNGVNRWYTM